MTEKAPFVQRLWLIRGSWLILLASLAALLGWIWFLVLLLRTHGIGAAGLFPQDHIFTDFYLYKPTFDVFHTPAFFQPNEGRSGFAYPPLVAPLYRFFYLRQHRISWYLLFTVTLWAAFLLWLLREWRSLEHGTLQKTAIAAAVLLTYPALFLLERGNLELFVWITVAAGVFLLQHRRLGASALCFGLAAALKLYPVVLLGLFFGRPRPLRPVLLGLLGAAVSTLLAILYTGPGFALAAQGFFHGVAGFQQHYGATVRPFELRFDHSLFGILKVIAARNGSSPASLTRAYYAVCAVVFSCLFFVRVLPLSFENRLLFLCVSMVLLPPVSYEYTLVHLYVPTMLLLRRVARSRLRLTGGLALVGLLVLLLPGDLLSFSTWFQAGQVQAVVLLLVAACASFPLLHALPQHQQVSSHI